MWYIMAPFVFSIIRSGEDRIKGPDEEREEEFATGPLSLLMQVSYSLGAEPGSC